MHDSVAAATSGCGSPPSSQHPPRREAGTQQQQRATRSSLPVADGRNGHSQSQRYYRMPNNNNAAMSTIKIVATYSVVTLLFLSATAYIMASLPIQFVIPSRQQSLSYKNKIVQRRLLSSHEVNVDELDERRERDCNNDNEFSMAHNHSFGLIDDIPLESWQLMQHRVQEQRNHKYPDHPEQNSLVAKQWYRENFEPDFSCPHERRIGGMGDGGKWVW
jgi:hypothetical protein